jgi:pimeloyl-ACP methyl ester carboxylesterase
MAGECGLSSITLTSGGVRLHAVTAGPEDGPAVVLLHGFPEFWYGWRKQIPALAAAGFHVVAPDQRGYNLSGKPAGVRAYRLAELTADVAAIADAIGRERIYLAGHDWGGAVAWSFALRHPGRVRRMSILNMPHPAVMRRHLAADPRQMLRSWYVLFFQLPRAPETFFAARNFRQGVRALIRSSRPGAFTPHDLDRYREAWSRPGAATAMINWYRALARYMPRAEGRSPLHVPVRILCGARDPFLRSAMAAESARYCEAAELMMFEDATHWLHHEEPARVNRALIEFFRE